MTNLAQSLIDDVARLSPDEQRFMRYIFDRVLVVGRASYSPWKAQGETRNMLREAAAEAADHVVYIAMDAVIRADERAQRRACELADLVVASFDVTDGEVSEVLR